MADPIQRELLRARALFAITYAAARYVPVPLVDDYVRERIALSVLKRSAAARAHVLEKAALKPLASAPLGCLGLLLAVLWVPIKLLLYPIRTLLSIALGVRWASRDLLEILALGRTLDRLLADGRFPARAPVDEQAAFARRARAAFDLATKGTDVRAVSGVLGLALGPLRKLVPAAIRTMGPASREEAPSAPSVEAPASRIVEALEDPSVRALLEGIDARFDAALASPS